MILYINTIGKGNIEVSLKTDKDVFSSGKIPCDRAQAELLLPLIEKLLKKNKFKLNDIKGVEVENYGGSFTSLRIGVVTANALGLALGVPVRGLLGKERKIGDISIVEPIYDREPDIGKQRNRGTAEQ